MFYLLIIFQILFFVSLIFVLRYFLTRNISSVTNHLEELDKNYQEKEQKAKKHLEEAEKHCQDILAKTKIEANQIKEKIKKEAQVKKDQILNQAHQENDRIIERAHKTRQQLTAEIKQQVEQQALDKACELIEQVFPKELHKKIHAYWLDRLISENFKDLGNLRIPKGDSTAELTTAFPLTSQQKEQLSKKLQKELNCEIKLKEKINSGLISGVVVHLGNLVIDGSLKYKLEEKVSAKKTTSKK